jgi:hypothetical protein
MSNNNLTLIIGEQGKPCQLDNSNILMLGISATTNYVGSGATRYDSGVGARAITVNVLTTGTGVGGLYDSAVKTGLSTANQFFVIPNAIGIYRVVWPVSLGLICTTTTGMQLRVGII